MARLPHTYKTEDEIPETINLREYATKLPDGTYRLDIAGRKKPTVWEDFEEYDEAMRKEREETNNKAEVNRRLLDEIKEYQAKITAFEKDGGALDKEEIIEFERLKRAEEDLKGKLEESQNTHNSLLSDLERKKIEGNMTTYLLDKVHELAIPDLVKLHSPNFSDVKGQTLTNDKNGGNMGLSMDDYFQKVLENPIYAKPNSGSGAGGGGQAKATADVGNWWDDLK